MRISLCGLVFAAVISGACKDSSGPEESPTAWANGTWVAVRIDGAALPHRTSASYPHTRTDSLSILVSGLVTPPSAGVFTYAYSIASEGARPIDLLCSEPSGRAVIGAGTLTTQARGSSTSIGNCATNWVEMTLSRKADSLVGQWRGLNVAFVKRP